VTGLEGIPERNAVRSFILPYARRAWEDLRQTAGQLRALATLSQRRNGAEYPDLIGPTRELLEPLAVPWVMENVPDTPLRPDIRLPAGGRSWASTGPPGKSSPRPSRLPTPGTSARSCSPT
jgi:DNA (cytosine-5)-methyltransferase 1